MKARGRAKRGIKAGEALRPRKKALREGALRVGAAHRLLVYKSLLIGEKLIELLGIYNTRTRI